MKLVSKSSDEIGLASLPILLLAIVQIVWGLNEGYNAFMGVNSDYPSNALMNMSAVCCIAAILFMLIFDNIRECAQEGVYLCVILLVGRFIAIVFPLLMDGVVNFIATQLPVLLIILVAGVASSVTLYAVGETIVAVISLGIYLVIGFVGVAGILGLMGNAFGAAVVALFSFGNSEYGSLAPIFLVLLLCIAVYRHEVLKEYSDLCE